MTAPFGLGGQVPHNRSVLKQSRQKYLSNEDNNYVGEQSIDCSFVISSFQSRTCLLLLNDSVGRHAFVSVVLRQAYKLRCKDQRLANDFSNVATYSIAYIVYTI